MNKVENEQCFYILSFMKSKLRNRLINHLDLIVCMFVQKFFTLEIFPYHEAILVWKKEKKWHAYNTWVIIEVQWCCVNCNDYLLQIAIVIWWLCVLGCMWLKVASGKCYLHQLWCQQVGCCYATRLKVGCNLLDFISQGMS